VLLVYRLAFSLINRSGIVGIVFVGSDAIAM
jgi:hypothetical protein